MPVAGRWVGCFASGWVAMAAGAAAGPAVNQFEIKDLEVEAGNVQFQSQNAFMVGNPRRRSATDGAGETVFDDNTVSRVRLAQELEVHLTSFMRMRVGAEFEKQRFDEVGDIGSADSYGALKLSELAIEGVVVLVPVKKSGVGFGLIAEYQHALDHGEPDTLFMGTLLQAVRGPWSATANLFLVKHFAAEDLREDGPVRDNKWDFAYAAQVKYRVSETLALAAEGYGTVDRLWGSGAPGEATALLGRHDQHRVGLVVYRSWALGGEKLKDRFKGRLAGASNVPGGGDDDGDGGKPEQPTATLGMGLLAGVTADTPRLTLKWSLEVEF